MHRLLLILFCLEGDKIRSFQLHSEDEKGDEDTQQEEAISKKTFKLLLEIRVMTSIEGGHDDDDFIAEK